VLRNIYTDLKSD